MYDDHNIVYAIHVDADFETRLVNRVLDTMREHLPSLHEKYEFEEPAKVSKHMNGLMKNLIEGFNERYSYKMIKKRDLDIVKFIYDYPKLYIT